MLYIPISLKYSWVKRCQPWTLYVTGTCKIYVAPLSFVKLCVVGAGPGGFAGGSLFGFSLWDLSGPINDSGLGGGGLLAGGGVAVLVLGWK